MIPAFPLAKIGLLFLKKLSKPVAELIKNEAKKHPILRKYFVIPTGKAYGWVEEKTLTQVRGSKPEEKTEEDFVELGSSVIGEIILFALLSGIIIIEYNRHEDKKAVIQRTKDDEIYNLIETVSDAMYEIESLKKSLKQIQSELQGVVDINELQERRRIYDDNFLDGFYLSKRTSMKNKNFDTSWDESSLGTSS